MEHLSGDYVDDIVRKCIDAYEKLPKSGKPIAGKQWTVLSCIIKLDRLNKSIDIVSLGTGTKCIGAIKMTPYILNDSHAEIIARRGFLLYLYEQIENLHKHKDTIFEIKDQKFKLKESISFAFFSSQMPCGDASIMPKNEADESIGDVLTCYTKLQKRPNEGEPLKDQHLYKIPKIDNKPDEALHLDSNIEARNYLTNCTKDNKFETCNKKLDVSEKLEFQESKSFKTGEAYVDMTSEHIGETDDDNKNHSDPKTIKEEHNTFEKCGEVHKEGKADDIHRTGAKCLPSSVQDPKGPGPTYHIVGQVRTKPGRGPRTLSVSCSDKIARWAHVGIQGALLDMLLDEPLYIKHFIFGSNIPYCRDSLERAIFCRNPCSVNGVAPVFYQSSLNFGCTRSKPDQVPCDASIIWTRRGNDGFREVAVQGRRLGATKKDSPEKSQVSVSKIALYKKFLTILSYQNDLKESLIGNKSVNEISLREMKSYSHRHNDLWANTKSEYFKCWVYKENIGDVTIQML